MSLDIDWSSLRPSLGDSIKVFLNGRLSETELPSMLRNIEVLSLDLGSVPPDIVIQDITDPFPEFYEDESEAGTDDDDDGTDVDVNDAVPASALADGQVNSLGTSPAQRRRSLGADHVQQAARAAEADAGSMPFDDLETASASSGPPPYESHHAHRPTASASGWEGMNLPFFHSQFAAPNTGFLSASDLSTPRPRFLGWPQASQPAGADASGQPRRRPSSTSSSAGGHDAAGRARRRGSGVTPGTANDGVRRGKPEDTQVEVRLRYAGDIVVRLRADLALDYPSTSFVTLPLEMRVSEVRVDTVAVFAHMEGRVHFSLLEGAENPVQDFHITSRIGEQEKVHLTDVEKVEGFMLREVQNMVEKELVFPSYYTFMI